MNINDLNIEYDKLQQEYGAKELASIYNGLRLVYLIKKYMKKFKSESHKNGMRNLLI